MFMEGDQELQVLMELCLEFFLRKNKWITFNDC